MSDREPRREEESIYDMWRRRNYLVATVGLAALSGCGGDAGDGTELTETTAETVEETDEDDGDADERPEGVSPEEFENGPVPDVYLSATSLGNEQRDPDNLNAKSDVAFAEYEEARENDAHQPGRCCANCADFIPDKNGDAFGACAEVDGYIDGAD